MATFGTRNEWKFILNEYYKEKSYKMKKIFHEALSKTKDLNLFQRFLNDQLNKTMTGEENCLDGILYASNNIHGNNLTWNFIKRNWDQLNEK